MNVEARFACRGSRVALAVVAMVILVGGGEAWGQQQAVQSRHRSVQDEPGEGDAGESEQVDEAADAKPHEGPYKSPYRLTFKVPVQQLLFDLNEPRSSVAAESAVPLHEWYTEHVRRQWGSWGVPARMLECPPQVRERPAGWKRERLVAGTARFIGYEYQHHHVPEWNPPAGWPWQQCCAGRNGKGVDCSNFSGWNYNWALGIHLNTDIHKQAERASLRAAGGEIHARVVRRPERASRANGMTLSSRPCRRATFSTSATSHGRT